jgi:type II secretory pathway pseudopilin PulG
MLKIKKNKLKIFTLMELLVSMAVFCVLLVIMLQFFSGAQRLWTSSEAKRNIYQDGNVAMELICTMLQNIQWDSQTPLEFQNVSLTSSSWNYFSSAYFLTKTKRNIGGVSEFKFVSFQAVHADGPDDGDSNDHIALKMSVFCDKDKDFDYCFAPFDTGKSGFNNFSNVKDSVVSKLNGNLNNSTYGFTLLKNITKFRISLYYLNASNTITAVTAANYSSLPLLAEIEISVIDPNHYERWYNTWGKETSLSAAAAEEEKEFRLLHGHTFRRMVFFNQR